MPCTDGGYSPEYVNNALAAEVFLCAVVRKCGIQFVIDTLDETAHGGTDKDLLIARLNKWWGIHSTQDAARESLSRREKEKAAKKAQALSKLTPEEIKALGL